VHPWVGDDELRRGTAESRYLAYKAGLQKGLCLTPYCPGQLAGTFRVEAWYLCEICGSSWRLSLNDPGSSGDGAEKQAGSGERILKRYPDGTEIFLTF
jgi:hypothetical protein